MIYLGQQDRDRGTAESPGLTVCQDQSVVITSDPLEYRVSLAQNWRIPLAQHTPIKRTVGMIYKLSDNIDNIDTAAAQGGQ